VRSDAIAVVEAAYELEAPERRWMQSLVEHTIPLVPTARRGVAYVMDASVPTNIRYGMPVAVGFDANFAQTLFDSLRAEPLMATLVPRMARRKVSTASELFGKDGISGTPMGNHILASGASDAFGCVALDAAGQGIVVSTDLPRLTLLRRAVRSRWELLGAHVAAAHRLRARAASTERDDCVAAPGGRILHAEGDAQSRDARDSLRNAVVARDRARTRTVRADPDQALALWPGLVSGRWSLVDRFESDGRRYVVARRNEPRPKSPFALTLREQQVLGHLLQGDSVKLTAYALGRSPSTVSETARTLLLKLGVRSVADLIALAAQGTPS
jgi:DNA-binding CsgD family transcriptional regulator